MAGSSETGRDLSLPTLPNLRDIGGYPTSDGGAVRFGALYRSTALDRLAPDDAAALTRLGIASVFDLRTEGERSAAPDRTPDGMAHIVLDVLADEKGAPPAQLLAALTDPAAAAEMLGGDRTIAMFERTYRDFVTLPSALAAYRGFFTLIAESDHRSALFHCTTGKDRTGWAAAATLLLAGVSEADVERDYLLTNRDLVPFFQPILDRFGAAGGDPELLRPVFGVMPEYLAASLAEMHTHFGTIEGYFESGLGIDAAGRRRLREVLTGPA